MRIEIEKEYEEKLKASIAEVEEYRKQMESTMKENDSKQIN